jgi:hypothetical protein
MRPFPLEVTAGDFAVAARHAAIKWATTIGLRPHPRHRASSRTSEGEDHENARLDCTNALQAPDNVAGATSHNLHFIVRSAPQCPCLRVLARRALRDPGRSFF